MKTFCKTAALAIGIITAASGHAFAQDSVGDTSAASGASVGVGAALADSGVRTVAAVAVLPIGAVAAGSAVGASVTGGEARDGFATGAAGIAKVAGQLEGFAQGPLPVTREVVVAPQAVPQLPYDATASPTPR